MSSVSFHALHMKARFTVLRGRHLKTEEEKAYGKTLLTSSYIGLKCRLYFLYEILFTDIIKMLEN